MTAVLLFTLGLILLIKGGDWFVDGATGIARRFHLPELLIGATVVSIGTTLPEVMVSTTSALSGHGEIAYGNAIGSIICNTALIAAVTVTIRPGKVNLKTLRLPVCFFFAAALIYAAAAYMIGYFSRAMGLALLLLFVMYMIATVRQMASVPGTEAPNVLTATASTKQSGEVHLRAASVTADEGGENSLFKDIVFLIAGAVFIAIGANLLVDNGTIIARTLGVPESVIALTFVALGTSLPELVTAITSLAKGHGSLSLGNVIGANLFNLVLVSGVAVTLSPFGIPQTAQIAGHNLSLVMDIPVMLLVMALLTVPTLIKGKLYRVQGILLLMIYAAFCAAQFMIK